MKSLFIRYFTLTCLFGLPAHSAVVSFEFATTEGGFSTIDPISATDAANGIAVERDYGSGNWDENLATDGLGGTGYGINPANSTNLFRYKIDLGSSILISTVNSYSYEANSNRQEQLFDLYGSTTETSSFDENDAVWTLIASVDMIGQSGGQNYGVSSISNINTSYRELMWVGTPDGSGSQEAAVYKEFDVIAIPEPGTLALMGISFVTLVALRRRR